MMVFLVNITMAEWKNSVFLKSIHSAGVSKFNFLFSLLIFNLVLSAFSVLTGLTYVFFLDAIYMKQIVKTMSMLGFYEWFGIFYGSIISILLSISMATIISGLCKSMALSQSVTTIFIVFTFVFSDCFLPPESMVTRKILVGFSYLIPYKHSVWASFLIVSDGVIKFIFPSGGNALLTYSFGLVTWILILTSMMYSSSLLVTAYYSFKWKNK